MRDEDSRHERGRLRGKDEWAMATCEKERKGEKRRVRTDDSRRGKGGKADFTGSWCWRRAAWLSGAFSQAALGR